MQITTIVGIKNWSSCQSSSSVISEMWLRSSQSKLWFATLLPFLVGGLCLDSEVVLSRQKRFIDQIDFEAVRLSVLDPSTLSNHYSAILMIHTFMATGWTIGGIVYQVVLSLDLSDGTRAFVRNLDFLMEPTNLAISISRNLRNAFFAITGRTLFNFFTNPSGTTAEIKSFTLKEHVDRWTSDSFLMTFLARFWFELCSLSTGIAILFAIGRLRRGQPLVRSFEDSWFSGFDSRTIELGMQNVLSALLDAGVY